MAKIKVLCECGENIEDVKEDLIKAFKSKIDAKDKFADPIMEELIEEADAWYNHFYTQMFTEIIEVLSSTIEEE